MEMEMDARSSEFRDWAAGLPIDLLYCVRDLLGFPNLVRFRGVCQAWRETIPLSDPRTSMSSPWVVIPGGSSAYDWEEFKLVSLPKNGNLTLTFPGARCVGSSGGWLALVDANLCITLVNALMSAADVQARAVKLPPLLRLVGNPSTVCSRTLQRRYIERIAFSSDPSSGDYAAAMLCRMWHGVAFTNSRRSGWQRLDWPFVRGEPHPPDPSPEDELDDRHISRNTGFDVVYHGGRFYYMTACGRIWALDATAPPGTPVKPVLFATSQVPRDQLLRYGKHMVFSEDGALHVVWSDLDGMPRMGGINGSLVRRWQPMRIQRYESGSPWGWREVHHLGGRAFPDRQPQSVGVLGGAREEEDVAESQLRLLHQH
ncbi:hypothetical protein ACQ4PT_042690 [Festuca glaucescens]